MATAWKWPCNRPRSTGAERCGNPEGRIIRVLERRQKELAVHVTRNQTQRGVLCRPADPRLDFLLDVDVSALKAAPKIGELLLVTPEEKVEDGLWRGTAAYRSGLRKTRWCRSA